MAERSHSLIERLLISLTILSFSDYCLVGKYMFYIVHHCSTIYLSMFFYHLERVCSILQWMERWSGDGESADGHSWILFDTV